jgi:predicted ATPase
MAKIKIRNVGPIRKGFTDGDEFLEIKGVTLFIGNQGSGKSTIAKLFSTLSWIEKALVRGDFSDKNVMQYNRFKKHLAYQNISNYLNNQSYIEYVGDAYRLIWDKNQLQVLDNAKDNHYSFPKIMYVPAERNFTSSVGRPDMLKRLPLPLYTFMDEYEDAKQRLDDIENLPIEGVSFEYRKNSKKSFIIGKDYRIELLEASSGFQSMVPLVLVTRHLSEIIKNKSNESKRQISREEEERIRKAVSDAMERETISEDVLRVVLEKISARFKYESFINVVEEPEQNLFPSSQKSILFELLRYRNENISNKLIITTHSPYLINFIALAVKAYKLKTAINNMYLSEQLFSIVPSESALDQESLAIYELNESDGSIKKLSDFEGIPSDRNFLNDSIRMGNIDFDNLLEIEQKINYTVK